jgi:hypothetical protein
VEEEREKISQRKLSANLEKEKYKIIAEMKQEAFCREKFSPQKTYFGIFSPGKKQFFEKFSITLQRVPNLAGLYKPTGSTWERPVGFGGTGRSRGQSVNNSRKRFKVRAKGKCLRAGPNSFRELFMFNGEGLSMVFGPILGVRVNVGAPTGGNGLEAKNPGRILKLFCQKPGQPRII